MSALVAVLQGLGLGLSLAAPPGPVNALIAREAARHGPWAGVRAGLPAPIVDSAYLILVIAGLPRIVDVHAALPVLSVVGAVLLFYLAVATARVRPASKELAGPWAVWGVTLTNPFQYAWWVSAGAAFMAAEGPWGIAGFVAAIFGWVGIFSFLVGRGASRWGWFLPALELLSADLLVVYALRLGIVASAGL